MKVWIICRQVEVAVSDTGGGIPAELQSRIFDFSFSRQMRAQEDKLGFGLWWVRTLMARLGALVISTNTVKRHLKAIFAKLEVNTCLAAVSKAVNANLFPGKK